MAAATVVVASIEEEIVRVPPRLSPVGESHSERKKGERKSLTLKLSNSAERIEATGYKFSIWVISVRLLAISFFPFHRLWSIAFLFFFSNHK